MRKYVIAWIGIWIAVLLILIAIQISSSSFDGLELVVQAVFTALSSLFLVTIYFLVSRHREDGSRLGG